MVADRDDWTAQIEALKTRRAARLEELRRDQRLADYYRTEPGLRDVLEHEHPVLQDMRAKVRRWGSLSDKQIAFACRLFSEAMCPEILKVEIPKVPAPIGRVVVDGVIVSRKAHEGTWGTTMKITVKVTAPEGEWLCWGSSFNAAEVGAVVRFRATLAPGREPHFAMFKRPIDLTQQKAA